MKSEKVLGLIDMCQASLSESTSITHIKQNGIDGNVFNFHENGVEGFWMEDIDNLYIVFRSTEFTVKEIMENFNFMPKNGFHRGVMNKISRGMVIYFDDLIHKKKDKKIVYLGHSLGGALARCVSYRVRLKSDVYTFGTYSTTQRKRLKKHRGGIYNYMISTDKVGLIGKIFAFFCGYRDKFIYIKRKGMYSMENHNLSEYRKEFQK